MAVLKSTVHVRNPESGRVEIFSAGSTPPEWAQRAIVNPKAWETMPDLAPLDEDGDHDTNSPVVTDDPQTVQPPDDEPDDEPGEDAPPPLSGPGSGEDAWRAHATRHGVDVSKAKGRKAVIEKLREAGVRVE